MLACCAKEIDDGMLESLRENAHADVAASSLAEATRRCMDAIRLPDLGAGAETKSSGTTAA
jgi:hypothetical protein